MTDSEKMKEKREVKALVRRAITSLFLPPYLVMFLKSDGFMPVWVLNLEEK